MKLFPLLLNIKIVLFLLLSRCGASSDSVEPERAIETAAETATDPLNSDQVQSDDRLALRGFQHSANKIFYANLSWIKEPAPEEYSAAEVEFMNSEQEIPESVARIVAFPWMSIHSHGSGEIKPIANAKNAPEKHIFVIENIYFHMSGPWELNIRAEVDQVSDTIQFTFEIP